LSDPLLVSVPLENPWMVTALALANASTPIVAAKISFRWEEETAIGLNGRFVGLVLSPSFLAL
jgi:hypothetical protein